MLDDHLAISLNGDVEEDLSRNYAPEVVVADMGALVADAMRNMGPTLPDLMNRKRLDIEADFNP